MTMAIDRRRFLSLLATPLFPAPAAADGLPLADLPGDVMAPELALPDLSGTMRRLSDYRGRPVLVAFWAVWCPPCRREIPALADLRTRLADARIEVLAVNLGDSVERIATFLANHPAPHLPILLDTDKTTGMPWHVSGLPVAFVLELVGYPASRGSRRA